MATIAVVTPSLAGAVVSRAATTPAGDVVPYLGGNVLLHFENGHASAVTVTLAPTKTTAKAAGAGTVTVPTRSLEIAAGAEGAILLKAGEVEAYTNSSRQIPVTYTDGNAALTVAAFKI